MASGPDGELVSGWLRVTDMPLPEVYPVTGDKNAPKLRKVRTSGALRLPNGVWKLSLKPNEEVQVSVSIRTGAGKRIASAAHRVLVQPHERATFRWRGKTLLGKLVKAGTYRYVVKAQDASGNVAKATGRLVVRG